MSNDILRIVAGCDGGNSSTKIQLSNKHKATYNLVFGERPGSIEKDYRQQKANESVLDHSQLRKHLDVRVTLSNGDVHEMILGDICNIYISDKQERKEQYKSEDIQFIRSTVTYLGCSIVESEKLTGDEATVIVDLCNGLPVVEHELESNLAKYKELFKGKHTIEFLHPGFPLKKLNIEIDKLAVETEGSVALLTAIATEGIHKNDPYEIEGEVYAMIDIGCYSVDVVGGRFSTIETNNKPSAKLNIASSFGFGMNDGIGKAQEYTISRIKEEYEAKDKNRLGYNEVITKEDISKANINGKDFLLGKYTKDGERIKIEPFYTKELKRLATAIVNRFHQQYESNGARSSLRKIYLCGGGSLNKVLTDTIIEEFEIKDISNSMVKVVEDPVFANAKGYYNVARVIASKK